MNTPAAVLLTSHLLATSAMVGLIWFVQVVHYPLFAVVGSAGSRSTSSRTSAARRSSSVR